VGQTQPQGKQLQQVPMQQRQAHGQSQQQWACTQEAAGPRPRGARGKGQSQQVGRQQQGQGGIAAAHWWWLCSTLGDH